ncbi:MAG: LuxR C-terminal-related transcriptional regulator [Gammaproteobacteria bacterium]
MTVSTRKLDVLIQRIHASAGQDQGWSEALAAVRELLCGRMAALGRYHFASGRGEKLWLSPPDDGFRATYAEVYAVRNPWFLSSVDYQAGRVMTGDELLRPEELARTDFYQRFLKRYGLYHRLCGVLVRRQDVAFYLTAYRAENEAAFDGRDKALFGAILQHLTIALGNHWKLLAEHSMNETIRAVIDRLAPAVMLIDQDGQVLFKNSVAEQWLAYSQTLQIKESRIVAASRAEDRALREAIQETALGTGLDAVDATRVVTLSTASARPVVVTLRPVSSAFDAQHGDYRPVALLTAKNPDSSHSGDTCAFASVYQLTSAQARLSGLIMAGQTLSQAAEQLKVSENTVRSHLKQIFQKTGAHSQMELVHLHARICTD